MFSDSGAPAPGEQKGFKPHTPHFIPWLRNSLKAHHSSDLGLNGPYKTGSEARNSLAPLEKAKGIGFFSIQGKDRAKKGELRCNGVGMARMLPVVLRGHHILPGSLGKQKEGSPAKWNQTKELDSDPGAQAGQGDEPRGPGAQDNHVFARDHQSPRQPKGDGSNASVRKYGPLVGAPPVPVPVPIPAPAPAPTPVPALLAEEPDCKVPVVMCMEDRRGKVWDYASHTTFRQRDLHSSSWLSADTQGLIERQHGFSSSFSYINKHSRSSQSQRDLTALREPPVEALNGPLSRVIFSTEVPHRALGCTTTLRGPRKPRPSSERIAVLGQDQAWAPRRPVSEGDPQRRDEGGCSRKVVRNQIKRVVDNLEQVLKALRDVHQEMREVVQQIDHLTASIDLNEEQCCVGVDGTKPPSDSSFSSGSSAGGVTVGGAHPRLSDPDTHPGPPDPYGTLRRDRPRRSRSPLQLCKTNSGTLSDRGRTLRFTCSLGSPPRQGGQLSHAKTPHAPNPPQHHNISSHEGTLSPQRSLPVRPPTPGLSPLTVNLHHPGSPESRPHSPGASSSSIRISPISPPSPLSPKPYPPPTLSPSVVVETKVGSHQTPQSDLPSASPLPPSPDQPPSAGGPPAPPETQTASTAHRERRSSSAGPPHACGPSAAKPPAAQGRRGRKPPPYPHHRFSEHAARAKEPREAPPYPEKRRLLSTTV